MTPNTDFTATTLVTDRRGVSEIIGAIFVFAILIMLLGIIQVWAVPAANQQTEFDHNQRAIADVQSLAADVHEVAGSGNGGSATLEVGTRYDNRLFLVNPPAPAGSLRTEEATATIDNVVALDPETADYVDGTLTLESRSLSYRPNYHEYRNAPVTRFEWGTVYNEHRSAEIVQGGRPPVSGDRISLVALDGRQSTTTGGTVTVPTEPISAPSRTVTVRSKDATDPITLTLTTGLDAERWAELLADDIADGAVLAVTQDGSDRVVVTLNESRTYRLRLAKVGIGPDTTEEGAHYLTAPQPRPVLDTTGGTVSVEVRDRFNNPVPGVTVSFSADDSIGLQSTAVSDEDGVATARFDSPSVNRTNITATAAVNAGPNSSKRGTVEFTNVPVTTGGQDDTGHSEINPDDGDSLKFVSSQRKPTTGNDKYTYVDVTFDNTGAAKTIAEVRMNAYLSNTFSGSSTQLPDEVIIDGSDHEVGGAYGAPDPSFDRTIPAGAQPTYRFEFRRDGAVHNPDQADFFVYSLRFEDGSTARYFIQMDVET